jgi:ADP-heptose:LPS heptosyltransferase
MKLGARQFLRALYWALRRNRRDFTHMLSIVPGLMRNLPRLRHLAADPRPKLAIALMEHIGDIVAAEPIARMARRRYPGSHLVWITRTPFAVLPAAYPDIDTVIAVTCLTEWMLLQRSAVFSEIWDLHIDGRFCPHCGIAQQKPGVSLNLENYFAAGSLLDVQCECAGLPSLSDGPVIVPPPPAMRAVDTLLLPDRFVAVHGASSDLAKDWPVAKWQDLVHRIGIVSDLAIVEVGTRALVVPHDVPRARSLAGALSLLETTEVIRRAELFIGVDSGPAHLANAVGTPAVLLLGQYRRFPAYTPYSGGYASGEMATLVRSAGPVAELSVDEVMAAVWARLRWLRREVPAPPESLQTRDA